MKNYNSKKRFFLVGLIVVMALTRGPWINDLFNLPNATLAIFFIAGIYFRGALTPNLLLLSAGFIDFFAVKSGVSSWCMTPAYGFLVPTYLCLWFAGAQLANPEIRTFREGAQISFLLLMSSTMAFIISTGSYHLFSGRFVDVPVIEQAINSMKYYPGYIGTAFLYVGIFLMGIKIKALFDNISSRDLASRANHA